MSRFDPNAVRDDLIEKGNNRAILDLLDEATAPQPHREVQLTRQQAAQLVEKLRVESRPELQAVRRDLRTKVLALPEGRLSADAARELRPLIQRPDIRFSRRR